MSHEQLNRLNRDRAEYIHQARTMWEAVNDNTPDAERQEISDKSDHLLKLAEQKHVQARLLQAENSLEGSVEDTVREIGDMAGQQAGRFNEDRYTDPFDRTARYGMNAITDDDSSPASQCPVYWILGRDAACSDVALTRRRLYHPGAGPAALMWR